MRIHRIYLVVVRGVRFDVFEAHAENCVGMLPVEPDVTLGSLSQLAGISTVVDNPPVFVRAPRVVARPSDNGFVVSV